MEEEERDIKKTIEFSIGDEDVFLIRETVIDDRTRYGLTLFWRKPEDMLWTQIGGLDYSKVKGDLKMGASVDSKRHRGWGLGTHMYQAARHWNPSYFYDDVKEFIAEWLVPDDCSLQFTEQYMSFMWEYYPKEHTYLLRRFYPEHMNEHQDQSYLAGYDLRKKITYTYIRDEEILPRKGGPADQTRDFFLNHSFTGKMLKDIYGIERLKVIEIDINFRTKMMIRVRIHGKKVKPLATNEE